MIDMRKSSWLHPASSPWRQAERGRRGREGGRKEGREERERVCVCVCEREREEREGKGRGINNGDEKKETVK